MHFGLLVFPFWLFSACATTPKSNKGVDQSAATESPSETGVTEDEFVALRIKLTCEFFGSRKGDVNKKALDTAVTLPVAGSATMSGWKSSININGKETAGEGTISLTLKALKNNVAFTELKLTTVADQKKHDWLTMALAARMNTTETSTIAEGADSLAVPGSMKSCVASVTPSQAKKH